MRMESIGRQIEWEETGSSNGGVKTCVVPPAHIYPLCRQMAIFFGQFLSKRKSISSASSDESTFLLETKRTKLYSLPMHQEDEIMTALESAMKKIEANLEKLEKKNEG